MIFYIKYWDSFSFSRFLFHALLIGFSVTLDALCEIKKQRSRPIESYVHFSTIDSPFSPEKRICCGFYRKKQLRKMSGEWVLPLIKSRADFNS